MIYPIGMISAAQMIYAYAYGGNGYSIIFALQIYHTALAVYHIALAIYHFHATDLDMLSCRSILHPVKNLIATFFRYSTNIRTPVQVAFNNQ